MAAAPSETAHSARHGPWRALAMSGSCRQDAVGCTAMVERGPNLRLVFAGVEIDLSAVGSLLAVVVVGTSPTDAVAGR